MIISKTPFRVSLLGGGTDFPGFYQNHGGAVLTMSIDKFVYVIISERYNKEIVANYSKKEVVTNLNDLNHGLFREALRLAGISNSVEITSLADIPSQGSGLGSSSSVTVGALNAFYNFLGKVPNSRTLFEEACKVEVDILGAPIGFQDQAIAAYGGLCFVEFKKDGNILIERLDVAEDLQKELASNLMLFSTNRTRQANNILSEQKKNIQEKTSELKALTDLAFSAKESILREDLDSIGVLLDQSWDLKKNLAENIADDQINLMYDLAKSGGALGGKIAGAGGGGYLLTYCSKAHQSKVRNNLSEYSELKFDICNHGSQIIFNYPQ